MTSILNKYINMYICKIASDVTNSFQVLGNFLSRTSQGHVSPKSNHLLAAP